MGEWRGAIEVRERCEGVGMREDERGRYRGGIMVMCIGGCR